MPRLPEDDSEVHLAVVAGTSEASDDMDHWVQALAAHSDPGTGSTRPSDTDTSHTDNNSSTDNSHTDNSHTDNSHADSSQRESRQP